MKTYGRGYSILTHATFPASPGAISAQLGISLASVRSALAAGVRDGRLERLAYGLYGLPSVKLAFLVSAEAARAATRVMVAGFNAKTPPGELMADILAALGAKKAT